MLLSRLFSLRCPECGERIDENEKYCPHCGTDLEAPMNPAISGAKSKEYLEKAQKIYNNRSNLKVALHNCDLSIQYDPNSASSHNLRGLILDALGRGDEAVASYQEALDIDPDFEDAKANLDDAYSELQNTPASKSNSNNIALKAVLSLAGIVILACFGVLIGILYKSISPYFEPKTIITLEPNYSLISTVDPSDLEIAAQILTERCRVLGCGTSFTVTENNQIIGKVPKSFDIETFSESTIAIGLLEFVDFGENLLPERTIVKTDFDYEDPSQSEETIWHTVMTNREIQLVNVTQNQFGGYEISFTLTPDGTKIFSDYTTNNIGKYLGIVLDKVVISAPRVNAPIPDGAGLISGNFTKEQAESLAVYLKPTGSLPIPLRVKNIE